MPRSNRPALMTTEQIARISADADRATADLRGDPYSVVGERLPWFPVAGVVPARFVGMDGDMAVYRGVAL